MFGIYHRMRFLLCINEGRINSYESSEEFFKKMGDTSTHSDLFKK